MSSAALGVANTSHVYVDVDLDGLGNDSGDRDDGDRGGSPGNGSQNSRDYGFIE